MARSRSQISSGQIEELRATQGTLDHRWVELGAELGALLSLGSKGIKVSADLQGDRLWAGLQGSACERVSRNMGGPGRVAPLCEMPHGLFAWLGVQEVWDVVGGAKPYAFRQIGLTVNVGSINDPVKPQILRLEWPGVRDWTGAGLSFQSPGAGHPHWQIDVFQSLALAKLADATFQIDPPEVVEEFGEEPVAPSINDLLRSIAFERMHLASAAQWWMAPTEGRSQHANAPTDVAGLTRWLGESVRYIRQELERCAIRR